VEFAPVAPAGLTYEGTGGIIPVQSSPEMTEAVEALRERWKAAEARAGGFATSALAFHDAPAPLLPGWGWPMAEPDAVTPIYDELCETMPDPRGTGPAATTAPGSSNDDKDTGEDR
jgi:hypothetical protein